MQFYELLSPYHRLNTSLVLHEAGSKLPFPKHSVFLTSLYANNFLLLLLYFSFKNFECQH